jgi:hypothetical protein
MKKKLGSILLLLLLISPATFAFDAVGHRIVAKIAYENLDGGAKKAVDQLLGRHGMIYAASWADDLRNDSSYAYTYDWHFQDLRDGMTNADFQYLLQHPTAEGEHLFYALDLLTNRLKKNKNDAEALKLIVHFMGDLHQPLHLGRPSDRGGNDIKIKWFGKDIRLHQLWDSNLIEMQDMSYTEYAHYLMDKYSNRKKEFQNQTMLASIEETYQVRNKIYDFNYSKLNPYQYNYLFKNDLDEQLYRAGIQLAQLLNRIY